VTPTPRRKNNPLAKSDKMSALAEELLTQIFDLQRRFSGGQWAFDGTIYSKCMFAVAKRHNKLRDAPVRGKKNVDRSFEQRVSKTLKRLVSQNLCEWRKTSAPEGPAKFALGYKRHKARDRDIFLTESGVEAAAEILRASGLMAEPETAGCTELPDLKNPSVSGIGGCDD
jgi:hypothetical protein